MQAVLTEYVIKAFVYQGTYISGLYMYDQLNLIVPCTYPVSKSTNAYLMLTS